MALFKVSQAGVHPHSFFAVCNLIVPGHARVVKPAFRIGRNPSSELVLNSTELPLLASRRHAKILFDCGTNTFYIEDCGSVNGVYLDSVQIPQGVRTPLPEGPCLLGFGGPEFVYRDHERMRNPFLYKFYPVLGDETFMRRRRGQIVRFMLCVAKLLAWRKRATETVFNPSNMLMCYAFPAGGDMEPELRPSSTKRLRT
jgi:hypothetical protein